MREKTFSEYMREEDPNIRESITGFFGKDFSSPEFTFQACAIAYAVANKIGAYNLEKRYHPRSAPFLLLAHEIFPEVPLKVMRDYSEAHSLTYTRFEIADDLERQGY